MTAGVAAARREPKGGWTRYGPPSYWSKLGRSKSLRTKRDYVAQRIAESSGTSMATARRRVLPYLSAITHHCKNREVTVAMAARYDLDTEHVAFVTGSGKDTNKVQSIVEDAEELRSEPNNSERADTETKTDATIQNGDENDGDRNGEHGTAEDENQETEEPTDQQSGLGDFL